MTRRRRLISQPSLIMQHQASVYPSNNSITGGVRPLFHEKTKTESSSCGENLDGNGKMRAEWWWGFDIASVALEMFQMSLQPHLRNIQLRPCQYEMHTTEWRGKFWQDLYFAWESWRWNKLLGLQSLLPEKLSLEQNVSLHYIWGCPNNIKIKLKATNQILCYLSAH